MEVADDIYTLTNYSNDGKKQIMGDGIYMRYLWLTREEADRAVILLNKYSSISVVEFLSGVKNFQLADANKCERQELTELIKLFKLLRL